MTITARKPLFGHRDANHTVHASIHSKKAGHPVVAVCLIAGHLAMDAVDKFFEEIDYKCPICGSTATETRRKK